MKKTILYQVLFIFLLLNSNVINGQSFQWVSRIGGPSSDPTPLIPDEEVNDMTTDAMGNIYTCGRIRPGANANGVPFTSIGGNDLFLAKYDCMGNLLWNKVAGNPDDGDIAYALTLDNSGHIYLTGMVQGDFGSRPLNFIDTIYHENIVDMFIAKFDTSGNLFWVKVAAPGNAQCDSYGFKIAIDPNGKINIIELSGIAGTLYPGFSVVRGTSIARFDTSGTLEQLKYIVDSTFIGYYRGFLIDADNNFYITCDLISDSIIIGGTVIHRITHPNLSDLLLVKLDSAGVLQWAIHQGQTITFANSANGRGICFDSHGDILFTGSGFNGLVLGNDTLTNLIPTSLNDFPFIAKVSPQGQVLWATNLGANSLCRATGGIVTKSNGNSVISGYFMSQMIIGPDTITTNAVVNAFIAEISSNGVVLHGAEINGHGGDNTEPLCITRNLNDEIFVGGAFSGILYASGNTYTSAGGYTDGFIAKWGNTSCTVGIEENLLPEKNDLLVYPNPASDNLKFRFSRPLSKCGICTVSDAFGRQLIQHSLQEGTQEENIPIGNLSSGLYYFTYTGVDGYRVNRKVLIEK